MLLCIQYDQYLYGRQTTTFSKTVTIFVTNALLLFNLCLLFWYHCRLGQVPPPQKKRSFGVNQSSFLQDGNYSCHLTNSKSTTVSKMWNG